MSIDRLRRPRHLKLDHLRFAAAAACDKADDVIRGVEALAYAARIAGTDHEVIDMILEVIDDLRLIRKALE